MSTTRRLAAIPAADVAGPPWAQQVKKIVRLHVYSLDYPVQEYSR